MKRVQFGRIPSSRFYSKVIHDFVRFSLGRKTIKKNKTLIGEIRESQIATIIGRFVGCWLWFLELQWFKVRQAGG